MPQEVLETGPCEVYVRIELHENEPPTARGCYPAPASSFWTELCCKFVTPERRHELSRVLGARAIDAFPSTIDVASSSRYIFESIYSAESLRCGMNTYWYALRW